jgi:glycogen synthase
VKIALLSRSAHPLHDPGGMERAVFGLATHLAGRGHRPILFTRPATHPGAFPGEVVTVPYGSLPFARHGSVLDRTLLYPGFAERIGSAAAARVRARDVDAVYAQGITGIGYALERQRDRGLTAPLVMNPQGMEEHKTVGLKRLALGRLRHLSRESARLADRVIATDHATRGEVSALLGVAPERVAVIPNGIELSEVDAATPADPRAHVAAALPALRDADPLFLSVGRIERYKGFDEILGALVALRARGVLSAAWGWAIVGDGPHKAELAAALVRAGLAANAFDGHDLERGASSQDPRVHLLGRVDETLLHGLYARADLFLHATHDEGSSLVTLEAMAHGLPVVATRAGGIPDKVREGETGWLAAPRDVLAFTRSLETALLSRAAWREMGRRGRERVATEFSWSGIAGATVALFEELLERRQP